MKKKKQTEISHSLSEANLRALAVLRQTNGYLPKLHPFSSLDSFFFSLSCCGGRLTVSRNCVVKDSNSGTLGLFHSDSCWLQMNFGMYFCIESGRYIQFQRRENSLGRIFSSPFQIVPVISCFCLKYECVRAALNPPDSNNSAIFTGAFRLRLWSDHNTEEEALIFAPCQPRCYAVCWS